MTESTNALPLVPLLPCFALGGYGGHVTATAARLMSSFCWKTPFLRRKYLGYMYFQEWPSQC